MNIADLDSKGGFVPHELVKTTVTWEPKGRDPITFDIHIKRQSFGFVERLFQHQEASKSRSAQFLADSVFFGDKGNEPLPYEKAYALDPSLAAVLIRAVNEVNGTGGPEEKN